MGESPQASAQMTPMAGHANILLIDWLTVWLINLQVSINERLHWIWKRVVVLEYLVDPSATDLDSDSLKSDQ